MEVGPSLGCLMAGHLLSLVPVFPVPQPGAPVLGAPVTLGGLRNSALRHPDSAASWGPILPSLFPSWTAPRHVPTRPSQGGRPLHTTLLCVPCWGLSTFLWPPEGLTTVPAPRRGQDPAHSRWEGGPEGEPLAKVTERERQSWACCLGFPAPAAQQAAQFPAL